MCDGAHDHRHAPAVVPLDLDAFVSDRIPVEPVERVSITTLVDNVSDALVVDQGPAHRPALGRWPRLPARTQEGWIIDVPRAEHGFSVLVEVATASGGSIACSSIPG